MTRNQEKAIIALLSHDKLTDAAKACNLTESTLWRYMQDESFQRAYKAARRQSYEQAIGRLQGLMNEAVNTLEKNLSCENPAVEVRAAQIIIELGTEGIKTAELIERVDALDKLMKGNKNGWTSKGA